MKAPLISIINEFGPDSAPVGDLAWDISRYFQIDRGVAAQNLWVSRSYQPGGMRPRRLLNALRLFLYLPWYLFRRKCLALVTKSAFAVLVVTTPPLLHWITIVFGKVFGIQVYVWYQDAHPHLSIRKLRARNHHFLPYLLDRIDKLVLRQTTGFIALDQSMKKHLVDQGVPDAKIYISPPWITYLHPAVPLKVPQHSRIKIIYAGNYGVVHDLSPMIRCLASAPADKQNQFEFHFLGINEAATKELKEKFANLAVKPRFHPRLPHRSQIGAFLQNFDLGLVTLNEDFLGFACPSKTFTYLSQGLPIVYVGCSGTLAHSLIESGFGINFDQQFVDHPLAAIADSKIPAQSGKIFDDPKPQSQAIIAQALLNSAMLPKQTRYAKSRSLWPPKLKKKPQE